MVVGMPGQFLCMGMGRRKARPSAMHDNYLDESPVQANLADDSNLPQCNVKSIKIVLRLETDLREKKLIVNHI